MLKDIMTVFEKEYEIYGDQLIIDNYFLSPGTYVELSVTEGIKHTLEVDKNLDVDEELYAYFAVRDYYSKLLDMNKPIDGKKVIHSNQLNGFFVKKESLTNGKLTKDVIRNYYNVLLNPRGKYKDKKKLEMYEKVEKEYGAVDKEEIEKIQRCVEENLPRIQENLKIDKNYLKIFIEKEEADFISEGKKYLIPNIYNSTDFNVQIGKETYGLPNNNMGLNTKKPYLENKNRKTTVPYLVSIEEVQKQKALFDYLMNFASQGKRHIFIEIGEDEKISARKDGELISEAFTGYYMRIQKGKELEIHDFDVIQRYDPKIEFQMQNILDIDLSKEKYFSISFSQTDDLKEIQQYVNEIYFNKYLINNYFTDSKDLRIFDFRLKEALIVSRRAWFDWFYKGNSQLVKQMLDYVSLSLIKNSIIQDSFFRARHQFNLYHSLREYFYKGDVKMADIVNEVKNKLRAKSERKKTASIESDDEYFFAVGQVLRYLLSLNKSSSKNDSLINPFLNSSNSSRLNKLIVNLFKKYNYGIKGNKRLYNLMAMVQGYDTKSKVNDSMILAGYLNNNIVYEKNENTDTEGDGEQ
ncbi:hypothetical protein [Psychrobacillus sp. NPDC093180]|uniref:hypothetical protein n=1 Tax=Psychrobacillus sp. NPDC093180 TaxID=3364489 RepID=UPI003819E607